VLLAFVAISDARTYFQPQDPKPVQPTIQDPKTQAISTAEVTKPEVTKPETTSTQPVDSKPVAPEPKPAAEAAVPTAKAPETFLIPAQNYTATAYSLRGRTASGRPVTRGLIAADPRVLPIGTRVRVDAGAWSGEYLVADTGGSVKGRRIDIWTPTSHEAMRFGRRLVKLTVLEFGGKRRNGQSTRVVPATITPVPSETQTTKQEK